MPIQWKKSPKLNPRLILARIDAIRTVSAEGTVSFIGFELEDTLPALQSMLEFPLVAKHDQKGILVWRGLAGVKGELTPKTFLESINEVLSKHTATRDREYHILTAVSVDSTGLPVSTTLDGATIALLRGAYPKKYASREATIKQHRLPIAQTPESYTRVIIKVKAKTVHGAMTKALRGIDLQRAVWCLLSNARMERVGLEWNPINKVRLGSMHTVHNADGTVSGEQVWFEPNFAATSILVVEKPEMFRKNSSYVWRRIKASTYPAPLYDALLRFVRALDERDQNTAFLRLWGALESLTSPDRANYDNVVRRCAFLHEDARYHEQIMEHLREYRNASVHSGDQGENAKTHCFQLQMYFFYLIRFHLQNAGFFQTLDEANSFLDLPPDKYVLARRKRLLDKAMRFVV